MPAVTQPTKCVYNVNGSVRDQYYTISGASGDTLTVGLGLIRKVTTSPGSLITAVALASAGNGRTTITFTSSAPMVAEKVQVVGN